MKKKEKDKHVKEEQIKEEQVKKEQDYPALWDKYVRLQAEFDNYRKRSFKERIDFIKFANEGLIIELLGILDNFERGIKSAEQKKDYGLLHQGVDMILKQLHSLLETKGLSRIKSLGQKFNPHQHEAVEVIEEDGVKEEVVTDELQPGYMLGGRVIRPAMVKVAKAKEKIEEKTEDREQKTEGREEKTEDREQKTEGREEKTEDREQKTEEGKEEEKEIGDNIKE